jgi:periplasmic divalent cation tolerance protein
MSALVAYITAPDRAEALRIGKALLEARLAACINVLDGMRSAYWWQGRIEEADECVLIAKSAAHRREEIIAKVKELHPYSVPCVVFWPIEGGNPEYLAWIGKESGDA